MNSKILNITLLLVVGFLFQGQGYSQDMYVKDNTFIYVSNQSVYVKNALELNAISSIFYLRNEGQLLQGTTGSGANKGVGSLSVFQEGTVNNYQFNYWCSPVGNVSSPTSVNNPFGIMQLGRPISLTATTAATASMTYDGTSSPLSIASFWVNKFQVNLSLYSDWVSVGSASTINPGEGFTMKGSSGTDATTVGGVQNNSDGKHQRYDFRGKPNDGTISIPVLAGEWTLTGNPYPSAIDLQAFLIAELNCTGTAYFWEQDKMVNSHYLADYKGGYGAYSSANIYVPAPFYSYDGEGNQISGTDVRYGGDYKRKYAPVGQGFMVEGLVNGNVQMKNSYRKFVKENTANNSEFARIKNGKTAAATTVDLPQIRFNILLNNGPVSPMVLAFDPTSTDGVDRADSSSPNESPANSYFVIDGNEYIIEVMPFDIDKKIPIGFRNNAEVNYKITVNEMINLPEVTNVYLHDKTTDLYHDIKNSLYDVTLPAGTYNTRYEITFKNGALGVGDTENQGFLIQQDNVNKKIIIKNPSQIELANCSLYDVVGKLVFNKDKLGTQTTYTFSTNDLSNGIYIVKLTTNDKTEKGQKIIVKN
ncbi:T9SS type A sorting domain-containing protein [Flavobacterium sp.]|uniref:T9SS type A sorting domain-containing protein n=1 Tax=Flavobacterium sp. TaxID=239 RepID=UPI0025B9EE4F|nr:T9SS type A sorting domain-containing protein [Flavobacterium sp.]